MDIFDIFLNAEDNSSIVGFGWSMSNDIIIYINITASWFNHVTLVYEMPVTSKSIFRIDKRVCKLLILCDKEETSK